VSPSFCGRKLEVLCGPVVRRLAALLMSFVWVTYKKSLTTAGQSNKRENDKHARGGSCQMGDFAYGMALVKLDSVKLMSREVKRKALFCCGCLRTEGDACIIASI
jgi:hypothetical protein